MIYCDAICHGDMYMIKCYVKNKERYVMSPKLCVYNMI